jgi:streptogramin lyase
MGSPPYGHTLTIRMIVDRMRRLLLQLGLLIAAVTAAPADAAVTWHGTLSAPAVAVVLGADGALWHVTRDGRVGRTDVLGATQEWALADGAVTAEGADIAAGWDGTMWVAARDGSVWGVSPLGHTVRVAETGGSAATAIAIGTDGVPWVAAENVRGSRDAIVRVTPDGDVRRHETGSSRVAGDLALGPDGALYFTEPGNPGRVARIDLSGTVTAFTQGLSRNRRPTGIATGADGALWFTEARGGAIGRLAGPGVITEIAPPLLAAAQPGAIAAGADGALYFTLEDGVGRITPAGAVATLPIPRSRPVALAAGPDGAIWFADALAPALGRLAAVPPAVPRLGAVVRLAPLSGEVRVRPPGARRLRRLAAPSAVPVGSVVDTRRGRVALVSATRRGGRQRGRFHAGLFEIRQRRSGLTRLALRGRLECGPAEEATASRRRRKRRRLWGADFGGAFSTLGRDSVTTVRGTRWLTEDRCGGTLTRVERGSVVVRARRTGERVVVRAGERHFVPRRP